MTPKQNWIHALRSGKYKQCREELRTDDKFCVLGVYVDIVAPQQWCKLQTGGWVNQEYEDCDLIPSKTGFYLGSMNDTGYNFNYIADWIENNVDDNLEYIGD